MPDLRHIAFAVAVGASALAPEPAAAHVHLTSHTTRHGQADIKVGPCGLEESARSDAVYTYAPGETITLEWDEYVFHPGYFRLSFDEDGDDDFGDPADYYDFYSNPAVLADNIYPHEERPGQRRYSYELTLPEVECDRCTLQLVQVMTDKAPYVAGTNDLYYNCVDLTLRRDETGDAGDVRDAAGSQDGGVSGADSKDAGRHAPRASRPDDGDGCSVGALAPAPTFHHLALLSVAGAMLAHRRRRQNRT